jgi:hypothetical protein
MAEDENKQIQAEPFKPTHALGSPRMLRNTNRKYTNDFRNMPL